MMHLEEALIVGKKRQLNSQNNNLSHKELFSIIWSSSSTWVCFPLHYSRAECSPSAAKSQEQVPASVQIKPQTMATICPSLIIGEHMLM